MTTDTPDARPTMIGEPVWLELATGDVTKAAAFYGALMDWQFHDAGEDFGHYNIVLSRDQAVAGAMAMPPEASGMPNMWCIYLHTPDIAATTAKVAEHGGQVVVEPMEIPEQGWMAFYIDPTGAAVGAWQPAGREGIVTGRVGAPYWFELMTKDYTGAIEFYTQVFDWTVAPMGDQGQEWSYSTLGSGDDARAGLCDASSWLGDAMPSFWRAYLQVADVDASLQTLTEHGGKLIDGPMNTPFGRIATVQDDQATTFQLAQYPTPE